MNWFKFAVTVSISVLSVAATHVSADKSWERSSVEFVQAKLNDLGYSAGPVDGAWGRKTSSALTLYCEEYDHDCSGDEQTVIDLLTTDTDDSYLDVEIDLASAIWFENRIGYGAPKDRVDRYVGMTRREAVSLVIRELKDYQDPFELPNWFYEMKPLGRILQMRQGGSCNTTYLKLSLKEAWLSSLYQSEVPQFDRLSVFWLDHFSVGYDTYEHPHAFGRHLQFVRDWKDKKFSDLLYASLSNPSTIVYLNNDKSDRNTPNENLAREFFELFALGEGNYTENDVREFAKLLTGRAFNISEEKYQFMDERAIKPTARIFGKRYRRAESLVRSLKDHPAYGQFLIQKFYKEYVGLGEVSEISMRRLQHKFLTNEQGILDLFESIISSEDFWNKSAQLTLVKSPLDLFAGTSRTLNTTGADDWNSIYWPRITNVMKGFDQDIFDPLSIDGWPEGKEWLQGSAIDRRNQQLNVMFLSEVKPAQNPITPHRANASWKFLNKSEQRQIALDKFFASARKDQVLIEDIIVESDRDFRKDRWFQIRLIFKNVRYKNQVIDQISVSLNHCAHCRPEHRNQVQLFQEMMPENFFRNVRYDDSDGDTIHVNFPFPLSAKPQKGASGSEYALVKNLARAASVLLDRKNYLRFRSEIVFMGPEGKKWLESILKTMGKPVDVYDVKSPVRLFDPDELRAYGNDSAVTYYFDCNSNNRKQQRDLDEYFNYEGLKMSHFDLSDDEFNKLMTKIWRNKPSIHDSDLASYLLPDFAEAIATRSVEDAFSLVEYNLK